MSCSRAQLSNTNQAGTVGTGTVSPVEGGPCEGHSALAGWRTLTEGLWSALISGAGRACKALSPAFIKISDH